MEQLRQSNSALQKFVEDYIQDFGTYFEDAEGREGYYMPTEIERMLIAEAVYGLN